MLIALKIYLIAFVDGDFILKNSKSENRVDIKSFKYFLNGIFILYKNRISRYDDKNMKAG